MKKLLLIVLIILGGCSSLKDPNHVRRTISTGVYCNEQYIEKTNEEEILPIEKSIFFS